MLRKAMLPVLAVLCSCVTAGTPPPEPHPSQRILKVVLYPFIPEFTSAAETVKRVFEAENPGVNLTLLDLSGNYYAPGDASDASYVGQVQADVIELDSVFLADFVHQHKIQELPPEILLPQSDLLANAYRGSIFDGKRYGAAHWACRNFLFFPAAAPPSPPITTLTQLEAFIGNNTSVGLLMDMKGKLTLGELYLMAAFDRFRDLEHALPAVQHLDKNVEDDLVRLRKLCPVGSCRDQISHELGGIYGMQFARKRSKTLIGYSELLHSVLSEAASCGSDCLQDGDIDVAELPLDDAGSVPISWVDSFTISSSCTGPCFGDAKRFIRMMNSDSMYLSMLLPAGYSFLTPPNPTKPVPAYLLPAKLSLYSNPKLLASAHLYSKLRTLVERAEVPTADNLNGSLRAIGKTIDSDLP
jgi:thiamine pyridinylase